MFVKFKQKKISFETASEKLFKKKGVKLRQKQEFPPVWQDSFLLEVISKVIQKMAKMSFAKSCKG